MTTTAQATKSVAITGASGLVGSELVAALTGRGDRALKCVRRPPESYDEEIYWSPADGEMAAERLEGIDAVVHLAGENIAGGRWNEELKRRIRESRVQGTTLVARTLAGLERKPSVLVCASAIGYYGDRGEKLLDESAPPGEGFLPDVCVAWESSCDAARAAGIRVVNLRIGVILSKDGGALDKMLFPFKMGVGGVMGSGKQYWSWVAIDDVIGAILHAIDTESLDGPVNTVAPNPVTNREFTKTLGRVLNRPTILPMPGFAARLALGEMANDLLLSSARVIPRKLEQTGYEFRQPELEPALRHVLGRT